LRVAPTAEKDVMKSLPWASKHINNIRKTITYIEKNPQTDSATLGFKGFFPNLIEFTALGCTSLVISRAPCFARINALMTLIPPPVDPAQAPMNAAVSS